MHSTTHPPQPVKTSYLESIPLTTSEDSTSKSDVNPFSAPSKKPETGLEPGKTVVSIQDSEASSRLSGSSMALIEESEPAQLEVSDAGKKEVPEEPHKSPQLEEEKDGLPIQESPPLFSPAKAPDRDVYDYASKHDLPRKEASKREEMPSDWTVLGVLGVLGVVLVGGVLWLRKAR